jgi:putative PIN family toxin of toxin-antitoxin system
MKVEPYQPVVIDTNVWLSAALTRTGTAAMLCRLLIARNYQPVFSPSTFDELTTRLCLPKFDRYVGIDSRRRFLADTSNSARWCNVPVSLSTQTYCRDPDDDKFIALAIAAQATRLITGDADLLCLDPLGELRILTPRAALDELQTNVAGKP